MTTASPVWKVLLIGGGSATGKSTAATAIAQRMGIECLHLDDFRLMLEQMTTPDQQPVLHFLLQPQNVTMVDRLTAEDLRDNLIGVARVMSKAIEIVIANHVAIDCPVIIEGDGLVPSLATQRHFVNLIIQPQEVRFVLLYEADEAVIFQNMKERKRGFDERPEALQRKQARAAWLYGEWLRQETSRESIPVVEPRPWKTLLERILSKAPLKNREK
jgi:2-phosphoglycerate kinase